MRSGQVRTGQETQGEKTGVGKKGFEAVSFERGVSRVLGARGLVWSGPVYVSVLGWQSRTYWVVADRQKRATGLAYTAADNNNNM